MNIRADTSHDSLRGQKSKFSYKKPSPTATTTVIGIYVKFMHYMTNLTPPQLKCSHISQSNLEINTISEYQ